MYEKIIVTKRIIEVFQYEKLNVNSPGGYRESESDSDPSSDENYKHTQRKRRNMVRQLICMNYDNQGSKFVTLTFRDSVGFDILNVRQCNEAYHDFIKRLRRRYPDLTYVTVIEFQDKNHRGAVHYHMLCNLPYIRKSELAEIWGNGFVYINRINHVDNLGAYVVKYMAKNIDDKRLQGLKAYNCSQGLQRPLEVKSWASEDEELVKQYRDLIKDKSPSYTGMYESENAGKIVYKQYNLSR